VRHDHGEKRHVLQVPELRAQHGLQLSEERSVRWRVWWRWVSRMRLWVETRTRSRAGAYAVVADLGRQRRDPLPRRREWIARWCFVHQRRTIKAFGHGIVKAEENSANRVRLPGLSSGPASRMAHQPAHQ